MERLKEVRRRHAAAENGGGAERRERQHREGKLSARERVELLLDEAKVAVAPGIGFGSYGDDHVRFGLIENEHRTRQAIRGIRDMFRKHNKVATAAEGEA